MKENAAYLAQTIDANMPQAAEPQDLVCPDCGKPGDGQLCSECFESVPY